MKIPCVELTHYVYLCMCGLYQSVILNHYWALISCVLIHHSAFLHREPAADRLLWSVTFCLHKDGVDGAVFSRLHCVSHVSYRPLHFISNHMLTTEYSGFIIKLKKKHQPDATFDIQGLKKYSKTNLLYLYTLPKCGSRYILVGPLRAKNNPRYMLKA